MTTDKQSPNTIAAASNSPSKMPVDARLIAKLRAILARTESPEEGEAQTAAEMLHRFLLQHNLSVADLESKGAVKVVAITEAGIDLGKAAFTWKLDLAESIAEHYFCVGIVNRYHKTITFVGRPDNVESLKMLYIWVVDQVKRLASDSRKRHQVETGEHIDPLRWQVHFGSGAVDRLMTRLGNAKSQADASCTALALHHSKEISDYTEAKYSRRYDGQDTAYHKAMRERWAKEAEVERQQEEAQAIADAKLLSQDPAAYYAEYPERHPDAVRAEQQREARNAARRARYSPRPRYRYNSTDWAKEDQGDEARRAGRQAADSINLEPFLTGKIGDTPKLGSKSRKGE